MDTCSRLDADDAGLLQTVQSDSGSLRTGVHAAFMSARADLLQHGYALLDGALSREADCIHKALARLDTSGALRQHRFGFKAHADAAPQAFEKPHIFEAELEDECVQLCGADLTGARHAQERVHRLDIRPPTQLDPICSAGALGRLDIPRVAAAAFPELALLAGTDGVTVKLQCAARVERHVSAPSTSTHQLSRCHGCRCNRGSGGCFPLHFDNAGPPSRRRLSILCYFNPSWKPGDGGELELLPWLKSAVVRAALTYFPR